MTLYSYPYCRNFPVNSAPILGLLHSTALYRASKKGLIKFITTVKFITTAEFITAAHDSISVARYQKYMH